MSGGNGYDYRGEDEALRRELQQVSDRQVSADQRITQTISATFTTIDRLASGLGRIADVEAALTQVVKDQQLVMKEQQFQRRMLATLMQAHGLEVPA